MPSNFGVPTDRPWGVDISSVQGASIDFGRLAASGCSWVTAKATEGSTGTDPTWERNAEAIKKAGMLVDAYHFLTVGSPVETQIEHFRKTALGLVDLPPTIDFESPAPERWIPPVSADTLIKRALLALQLTSAAFGRANVYTYPYFMQAICKAARTQDLIDLSSYPLWIASYHDEKHAPKVEDQPTIPAPWFGWQFWQWSGDHGLPAPGIPCVVDHDVFNGSALELENLCLPGYEVGFAVPVEAL